MNKQNASLICFSPIKLIFIDGASLGAISMGRVCYEWWGNRRWHFYFLLVISIGKAAYNISNGKSFHAAAPQKAQRAIGTWKWIRLFIPEREGLKTDQFRRRMAAIETRGISLHLYSCPSPFKPWSGSLLERICSLISPPPLPTRYWLLCVFYLGLHYNNLFYKPTNRLRGIKPTQII